MTFRARNQIKINQKRTRFIFEGEDEHRDGSWKTFLKNVFFGTEIGERKVGNYLEQDGLDGQTSLWKWFDAANSHCIWKSKWMYSKRNPCSHIRDGRMQQFLQALMPTQISLSVLLWMLKLMFRKVLLAAYCFTSCSSTTTWQQHVESLVKKWI